MNEVRAGSTLRPGALVQTLEPLLFLAPLQSFEWYSQEKKSGNSGNESWLRNREEMVLFISYVANTALYLAWIYVVPFRLFGLPNCGGFDAPKHA
jgi:hypothetical protein